MGKKNCIFHLFVLLKYLPIEKSNKLILSLYSLGNLLLKKNLPLFYFQPFDSLTLKKLSTSDEEENQAEEQ